MQNTLLMSDASREVMFLRQLIRSVGFDIANPTPLLSDNNGALAIARNPCDHQRSKHIDIRYHYIRERADSNDVALVFVGTEKQLADVMTKALGSVQHTANTLGLGIRDHSA